MSNQAYFEQLEQNINGLIANEKYREAYNLCKEILNKFPDEKKFLKIKEKIEEAAEEKNNRIIESKLESMDPLWDQKKYAEILRGIKDLLNLAPNNEKLKKLYSKAQGYYAEQIEELKKDFKEKQSARLNELLNTNPDQLVNELFELEMENPGNQSVREITIEFRDKIIAKRISEKEELIHSDKYDAIENFIAQLKKIDTKNPRIGEVENIMKQQKMGTIVGQKKEFMYSGLRHLDTLMKLKKYDKAIKVANELLSIEKNSLQIKRILNTAERKYFYQTKNICIENILSESKAIKEDYQRDKSAYIRI